MANNGFSSKFSGSWEEAELVIKEVRAETAADIEAGKALSEALGRCKRSRNLANLARLVKAFRLWQERRVSATWPLYSEKVSQVKAWALKEAEVAFRKSFKSKAAQSRWEVRCVGSEPLEFKVGPFSVRPQFASGTFSLAYARVLLADNLPLDSDCLFRTLEEQAETFNKGGYKAPLAEGISAESAQGQELFCQEMFADIWTAYKIMLRCRRKGIGDRVPLHDIWAILAVLRQSNEFAESGTASSFREYSRAQFCWDIVRLRRCGGLQRGGLRLNLSTATIGTTKNKEQVFWLDDGVGSGQYYLSLWFQNKE